MHYLAQYTKEVSWLHAREMDIVHLSRYKKKKKDNGSDKSKVYFKMTYLAHWCFLQLENNKMTAREQTVVSLFRVMQNSSDLFSLIANSGAPHARGAPFLREFGNLSIREVLVVTSAYARRPSVVNRCQKSHFNTS